MIRIVSGELKGRRLEVPRGIRPTTEMARKAALDMAGDLVAGARVLDAAAGSGAYGAEALSRGARHAVFIEPDARVRATLRKNLERIGLLERSDVIGVDVASFVSRRGAGLEPFDVVFHDPPYDSDSEADLAALLEVVAPGGLLLHERGDDRIPPVAGAGPDRRRYGTTRLLVYRR